MYDWEHRLNHVASTGMARAIKMIKLALKEMPRLHTELLSRRHERHAPARKEARALFKKLDEEITKVRVASDLPSTEFFIALRNPAHYTPEEQDVLNSLPALLKLYGIDLFAPQSKPLKRNKHIRFKV